MSGLKMTQEKWVHDYLKVHGRINQRIATDFGITRLAARINDLRKEGVPIETHMTQVNTRWNNGKASIAIYIYKGEAQ